MNPTRLLAASTITLTLLLSPLIGCGGSSEPTLGDAGMSPDPLPQAPAKRPTADPEINAYLDDVIAVYADAKSYRDSGTIKQVATSRENPDQPSESSSSFRTLYVRPDLFRLDVETPAGDDKPPVVNTYWTDAGPSVLHIQAGNSAGTDSTMLEGIPLDLLIAKIVPRLLIKEIAPGHRKTIDRMESPELKPDPVDIDGRPHREFHGFFEGARSTAFFDAETHLLRRLIHRANNQGGTVETIIDYTPELNPEITVEQVKPVPTEAAAAE